MNSGIYDLEGILQIEVFSKPLTLYNDDLKFSLCYHFFKFFYCFNTFNFV